MYSQNRN
ncbi:hypothetical protein ECEC1870_3317, partial [Escherichia coli EC1870]